MQVSNVFEILNISLLLHGLLRLGVIKTLLSLHFHVAFLFIWFDVFRNLSFKSEKKLARWISAYLIYGDLYVVCLVCSVSFKFFWSLFQLVQNCCGEKNYVT